VFLNDWGCAATTTQPIIFRGALRHAPNRILKVLKQRGVNATYSAQPADDLQMVVKVVFEMMNLSLYSQISHDNDPNNILSFWQSNLGSKTVWVEMLMAAKNSNYDLLSSLICKLL